MTSTYFHFDSLEYYTEHYWKVKTIGKVDKSNWFVVFKFITHLHSPTSILPVNEYQLAPIKGLLRWGQVINAIAYELQILTAQNFEVNKSTFTVETTLYI